MYWKISKFLLSHENLNMDKLPGFYQFFYSSDFQVVLPGSQGSQRLLNTITQPLPLGFPADTACYQSHCKQCRTRSQKGTICATPHKQTHSSVLALLRLA